MKFIKTLTVALGVCVSAGSVSAAVIYTDGFNRSSSNTVGNGWAELQNNSDDVAIRSSDYLRLRDSIGGLPDAAAASTVIDATGFEQLEIRLKWRAFGPNDPSDRFFVSWANDPRPAMSNEGAWNTVLSSNYTGTSYRTDTISISPGADNSIFNIMLWTDVSDNSSGNHEGYAIDWIQVLGDEIPAPVPLPAAGWLMVAGLGGLFAAKRRRQKRA